MRYAVLAIIANVVSKNVERARAARFTDYLTKPLDVGQLLRVVGRALAPDPHDVPEW
jgi:CheY-like chemotaxis protein